jgi:ABC-2 type transport system ATP-binding protein
VFGFPADAGLLRWYRAGGRVSAIELRSLRKVFRVADRPEGLRARIAAVLRPRTREIAAVRGIDLRVEPGQAVAFLGANGAGKSTTIKMLTGILHPTDGEATVLGLVPWRQRKRLALRIGTVFGARSQLWLHLPPVDTFNLLSRIYELDRAAYLRRRDELVALFELGPLLHTPTRKLSLGQRMRCEIAASLLHRPEVLFLDEPTIGLDPIARASIRALVRRANREEGVTVFLTSHDMGDVEQVCERVVILHDGAVVVDESLDTLRRRHFTTREVELVLASPPAAPPDIPGAELVELRGCSLRLRVDVASAPIDRVIGELLRRLPVVDIAIAHPPIERVVLSIYQAASQPR